MEENKNGQGFWVESNFEPNPNYQPKRRQKAKGGTSKHKAGNSSALSGLNALLPSLTRFFPRLSGIISLGTGIVLLFGGLGKFLKRGCLILVVGIVVIIALLWGLGTCMGIDDDGHQVKAVADSTIVESEPVAEPETIAEPETEQEVTEPVEEPAIVEEPKPEPVEVSVPEPEPEKPKVTPQQNPQSKAVNRNKSTRKRSSKFTDTPPTKKKKGYGFRLERVDHIPTKDNP